MISVFINGTLCIFGLVSFAFGEHDLNWLTIAMLSGELAFYKYQRHTTLENL